MLRGLLKVIYTSFVILLLCSSTKQAFATHSMGTDLTYKCLGGNTYEITLTFYRDCFGIPAPNNVTISMKSASCGYNLSFTIYPIAGTGQEISPTCSSAVTTCHGGSFTGIQEWVYKGIYT